ncbi:hypothetical protein CRENBAI_024179, partial [Crenichthys baileyi]
CVSPGCRLACAVDVMKNPGAAENRQLLGLLEAALLREARLWKVPVFKNGCIQAKRKYLKCIAFTSLVLAAKINEEDVW